MGSFSWKKIREKVESFSSRERGIFGLSGMITAIVLIAIFAIVLILLGSLDDIVRWLAGEMNIARLLIHIPPLAGYPGGPAEGATVGNGVLVASDVAGRLYGLFQTIGSALMVVAFVVIGMSFVFEQFNVLQQGQAQQLLSESVLVLILLFIFPWLFNAGAVALNSIDKDMVMNVEEGQLIGAGNTQGGIHGPVPDSDTGYQAMVGDVAAAAGEVPSGFQLTTMPSLPLGEIPDPSAIIVALATASVSFMALFTAFAVGAFKLMATAALAAAFPLILVLRLIPPLRQLSQQLTNAVIGIMMASLVGAIFFRTGWEILQLGGFSHHSGMVWVMGVGTLFAAAGAMTITTRTLYGVTRMLAGGVGRGAAATVGGMVAAAGGAATAGGASAVGAGRTVAASGQNLSKGEMGKTIAGAGGRGMLQGGMGRGGVGSGHAAGEQHALQKLGEAGPEAGQMTQTGHHARQAANQELATYRSLRESGHITDAQAEGMAQGGKRNVEVLDSGRMSNADATDFHAHGQIARGERESYNPDVDREAVQTQVEPRESKAFMKEVDNHLAQDPSVSDRERYAVMHSIHEGSLQPEGKNSTIPDRAESLEPTGERIDTSRQGTLENYAGEESESGEESEPSYETLGYMDWGGQRR